MGNVKGDRHHRPAEDADDLEALPAEALRERVRRLQASQAELANKYRYYRTLYEQSPVGHLVMSEDGIVLEANAAAERILGIDEGELIDTALADYVCEEDETRYLSSYGNLFESLEPQSFEIRLQRRDGSLVFGRLECTLLDLPTYDTTICHVILSDVSLYREAERVLQRSEARYRLLFENSPVALWEQDYSAVKARVDELRAEGVEDFAAYLDANPGELRRLCGMVQVHDVNRAALELHEASSQQELLRALPEIIMDRGYLDGFRATVVALAQGEMEVSTEHSSITLTGERIHVVLNWNVVPDHEETYGRVLTSQTDITRLKHVETQLAAREVLYRTIVSNLPNVVVMMFDHDLRYLLVEGRGLDTLSRTSESLEGKTLFEVIPPKSAAELVPYYRSALQGETVRFERVAEGSTFDVISQPVRDPEGNIVGGLIFARDISEEKEREIAVWAERQRIAREMHDAVSQTLFSANMITDALPYLLESSPGRVAGELEKLHQLTDSALAEMRSLLVELRPYAIDEADLDELLNQLAKSNASRTNTLISVSASGNGKANLPTNVKEGLYRIAQQALNNIIYHAHAEWASIELRAKPGYASLSIRDNGQGFDLASVPPGRMGLTIMQERAEAIGAEFSVTSEPGVGTEVTATWRSSKEMKET